MFHQCLDSVGYGRPPGLYCAARAAWAPQLSAPAGPARPAPPGRLQEVACDCARTRRPALTLRQTASTARPTPKPTWPRPARYSMGVRACPAVPRPANASKLVSNTLKNDRKPGRDSRDAISSTSGPPWRVSSRGHCLDRFLSLAYSSRHETLAYRWTACAQLWTFHATSIEGCTRLLGSEAAQRTS